MLSGGGVGSSVAGGTRPPRFCASLELLAHRRDEAIPLARNGLDERRIVGAFAEGVAQPVDRSMEPVFEVDEGVRGPEMLAEQLAGDELAGRSSRKMSRSKGLPA